MPKRHGFTLIELLVVITIIVVLLALLAPAMDKAIYQTELAVCGANLRGVGMGTLSYTSDHGRTYPLRYPVPNSGWSALNLNQSTPLVKAGGYDFRTTIRGYIDFKMLVDPLSGRIDVSPEANGPTTLAYANYHLYMGWWYLGHRGMKRVGDRFDWQDRRFRVLAGDRDAREDGRWANSSHPDRDRRLAFERVQDDDSPWGPQAAVGLGHPVYDVTFSWWHGPLPRGGLDLNYLFDDLSVIRHEEVQVGHPQMAEVPDFADGTGFATRRVQLPAAD